MFVPRRRSAPLTPADRVGPPADCNARGNGGASVRAPISTRVLTPHRDGLDQALSGYVTDCYHDGVCAVYALPDPNYPAPVPVPAPEPVTAEEPPTNDSEQVAEENEIEAEQDQPVVEEDAKAGESEGVGEPAVEPAMEPTTAGPTELAEEGGKELSAEDGVMAIDTPAADKEDTAPPVVEEPVAPAVVRAPAVESRIFSLYLVGNRYNPSNYWYALAARETGADGHRQDRPMAGQLRA